jgi:hypothetical protein
MWSAANTKFMVTNDFNKDGYADIAAMYDYGNGKMGIWNFESNGTIMTPRNIYMGANGNWDVFANKLLTAGDHNNDGTDDITAMYDYGNGMVGLWTFVYGNGQLYPRRTLQGYGWSPNIDCRVPASLVGTHHHLPASPLRLVLQFVHIAQLVLMLSHLPYVGTCTLS